MLEREIVQKVVDSGFLSGRSVFTEIPVGRPARSNKRIDIVALEENSNRQPIVIAIEAKIANWRKALQQAFLNLFVAEYSYVAVPEIRLRSIDRDRFFDAKGAVATFEIGSAPISSIKVEELTRQGSSDFSELDLCFGF